MAPRISILPLALVPLGIALNGCASTPPPVREIAHAEAAVRDAARVAEDHPDSQLNRARVKTALAQRWMAARDFQPALWLAEQARVDAELALALAAARGARGIGSAE